ncbi:MAG TPA: hypothetical protein VMM36_07130 [Opitutaceae bacterium]|nr:hypothetical protein [Opitutaceae bacterium]
MSGAVVFVLFGGAALIGLVVFVMRAVKKSALERNVALREMAGRLGFEYREDPAPGMFAPRPVVAGMINGRRARVHEFTRGSGKSRTSWVAASVQILGTSALKFTMRSQGPAFIEKIAGAFGYKDIVVGDPAFDAMFAINSSDETYLKAALIPEVRMRLVAFWPKASGGRITVGDGEAVYEQQGSLSSASSRERLENSFPVLGDMVALAEVHATGTL